jgi:hypothetical protein
MLFELLLQGGRYEETGEYAIVAAAAEFYQAEQENEYGFRLISFLLLFFLSCCCCCCFF